jgi:uncharacterized RDD family membrane protein YckC
VAYFIYLVAILFGFMASFSLADGEAESMMLIVGTLFIGLTWFLIFTWIYSSVLESSPLQATLGKMAMQIVVTDIDGQRISFLKATERYLCKIISILMLFIGYILAVFTTKKQALHDILCGCLVVLKKSSSDSSNS